MGTVQSKDEFTSVAIVYFFILILPFLLFYWIMPFVSDLMMGNDFRYSVHQQMEMLFSLKTGSFPLYHPAYALGQSSVVMTWSQIFHPISHISSMMPGYWDGMALQWYTFFKLISLGMTQLVLFIFIRNLKLNLVFSFLISLITVYNLRMLDLFRFGASLEAYTGYLFLCASIGWYFIRPVKILGPLSIIGATYMLVVSGHPQHMYYAMLGAGLFLITGPFILSIIQERAIKYIDALRFWIKSGIFILTGILLSSVYILPFVFDFYTTNTGRADATYEWSVAHVGIFEMLGNFFMPFVTDIHGVFGGSSLIIIALLLPVLKFIKIKIPASVWIIWGLILFVILFILGDSTPIYKVVWTYMPFLSAFRHQGRASLILSVFLMLIIVWVFKREPVFFRVRGRHIEIPPYSVLSAISVLLIPLFVCLFVLLKPYSTEMPPTYIHDIPQWISLMTVFTGMAALIGLFLYGMNLGKSRIVVIIIFLMSIVQIVILMRYGTFEAPNEIQPTFEEMLSQKKLQLGYRSHEVINMHTSAVITQLEHSFIEPFLGKIYNHIIPVDSQEEAYKRMLRERLPQQLFIEDYDTDKAGMITSQARENSSGRVELVYSSFNRLKFRAVSQFPALLGFSFPYTGHWRATVNGNEVRNYRANGTAHAVEIPEGESEVEFRYWSDAFFWGMAMSCATLAVIGLVFCFLKLRAIKRLTGVALVLIVSVGVFMLWYNSLFNGDSFETEYTWTYKSPLHAPNLAYGKKTLGYSPLSASLLRYHGSNAVDGDTAEGSGFTLNPFDKPLIVDLNHNEDITSIVLYGQLKTQPEVSHSQDGNQWQKIPLEDNKTIPLRILFEKPQVARFVRVSSPEDGLGIDELEVYGDDALKQGHRERLSSEFDTN